MKINGSSNSVRNLPSENQNEGHAKLKGQAPQLSTARRRLTPQMGQLNQAKSVFKVACEVYKSVLDYESRKARSDYLDHDASMRVASALDRLLLAALEVPESTRKIPINDGNYQKLIEKAAKYAKMRFCAWGKNGENVKSMEMLCSYRQLICKESISKREFDEFVVLAEEASEWINQGIEIAENLQQKHLYDRDPEISKLAQHQAIFVLFRKLFLLETIYSVNLFAPNPPVNEIVSAQERLLDSCLRSVSTVLCTLPDSAVTDVMAGFGSMRPIFEDLSNLCEECALFALTFEPANTELPITKNRVNSMLNHCNELNKALLCWLRIAPSTNASASIRYAPGDWVSVRGPSGLHVAAKVQPDGSALTVRTHLHCIQLPDGSFALGGSPDEDSDYWTAQESSSASAYFSVDDDLDSLGTESEAEFEFELEFLAKNQHSTTERKAINVIDKAKSLLAQTHDFEKEARQLLVCSGHNDPDVLKSAGLYLARNWQDLAGEMNRVANRLAKPQLTRDAQPAEVGAMIQSLRERANVLHAKAEEISRPEAYWSSIKSYKLPKASQWEKLLEAKQIRKVGEIKELPDTNQGTLFEVRIDPLPDSGSPSYPPVWMHLHTKKTMTPKQVRTACLSGFPLSDHFNAVHLKSDLEKNLGRKWVDAQKASGRTDARVHRSSINDPNVLRAFLNLQIQQPSSKFSRGKRTLKQHLN